MNFIGYKTIPFNNLADSKTILLSAEKTLFLNGVNICNRTNDNIRINLKLVRLLSDPTIENFIVNNVLLQPNQSCNLLSLGSLQIFLEDGDNLLCFSNGYNENFDCTLCYTELNESIE